MIKSRGFQIKNILNYDLVIFQTSSCLYLEFNSFFRILSVLILTHFKPMFQFYSPLKISESSGFLMFEGVRNETLAELDYQQYQLVVLSYFKLVFLSYTRCKYQKASELLMFQGFGNTQHCLNQITSNIIMQYELILLQYSISIPYEIIKKLSFSCLRGYVIRTLA